MKMMLVLDVLLLLVFLGLFGFQLITENHVHFYFLLFVIACLVRIFFDVRFFRKNQTHNK